MIEEQIEPASRPGGDPVAPEPAVTHKSYALNRPLIIVGLIAATALSALDATIVATALPSIVGVLGGLPLYSLVISVYFLTSTTTVPLYGKLSDMYGRKPVFMVGTGIFIFGSALCGFAWDMPSLIVFRAIQGLGAGAVLPISLTLIGDLFDIEERARLQGVFGAVWGVSSVIGPLVGGAIVQYFDWRWVFFINVPVGIASSLLIFLYLREPSVRTRQRVDVAGVLLLTGGVALLLLGIQAGGQGDWLAPGTWLALGGGLALLLAFVVVESRAEAPLLSLDLLGRPIIAIPCLAGLLAGGVLVGFAAYVPPLVQGAWGGTPTWAGLMVAPLSIGWPLASSRTGRLILRFGYRAVALGGMVTLFAGTLLLLLAFLPGLSSNPLPRGAVVAFATFVSGAGFGFSTTSMLIAVQNAVPWNERGIATASVQFFRNMGNTLGSVILGSVLTATLAPLLTTPAALALLRQMPPAAAPEGTPYRAGSDPTLGPVNALFDLTVRDTLPAPLRSALSDALTTSLGWVYVVVALMALVGALLTIRFPRVP